MNELRLVLTLQNTVRNGIKGTRQQCVEAARLALLQGDNAIIKRVNFDAVQHADFVSLAKQLHIEVK